MGPCGTRVKAGIFEDKNILNKSTAEVTLLCAQSAELHKVLAVSLYILN